MGNGIGLVLAHGFLDQFWCKVKKERKGAEKKETRQKEMRGPGVEPGSLAWKARMITVTLPTLLLDD